MPPFRRFLLLFLFLPLLAASSAARAAGVSQFVWYSSSVDNSEAAYGVYLPDGPAPSPAGFPAVFHGHGYGWGVNAYFTDWQKQWADDHGWVLLNINARGPNFYGGIGDVAVQEIVRDASARFNLDPDRLYFTGVSMGGTGAYRQAVFHPDVFAAAAPVDGWTDYRLWHARWYARTDAPDAIEEFRRPLLETMSPLFFHDRLQWGALLCVISGRDQVVKPEEGFRMVRALRDDPDWHYDVEMAYNEEAAHGHSNDLPLIYRFFESRRRLAHPTMFTVSASLLSYGALYWARLEEPRLPGVTARARVIARGDSVEVLTTNLNRFTLLLDASPLASSPAVTVYVDGFPAYTGPPVALPLLARRTDRGDLSGWAVAAPADTSLRKRAGLEGPLGDAFNGPFLVVYASTGPADAVDRHRAEAESFCSAWNNFNVHAEALRARSETDVAPAELAERSLVLFGSQETSTLLQSAQSQQPLPVEIHEGEIIVRDPLRGDRHYRGSQYGAFFAYPNPLSGLRHYLVVCSGEWPTRADGTVPVGLGYDLEKLNWSYPDYVVFDTDPAQLPWVKNVNNKPEVTCYEAGYFVEAGYFDQQWRPDALLELRRFDFQAPAGVRRISVSAATLSGRRAAVRLTDSAGAPVRAARVTVAAGDATRSAATGDDGWALFPLGAADDFTILNVMATGAVYDWRRDLPDHRLAPLPGAPAPPVAPAPAVRITALRAHATAADQVQITAQLLNSGPDPLQVPVAGYLLALGLPLPSRTVPLPPGASVDLSWTVNLTGPPAHPATYQVRLYATAPGDPTQTCDFSLP